MVQSLDDMQRRLANPVLHVQFNGFCLLLQVGLYTVFRRLACWYRCKVGD